MRRFGFGLVLVGFVALSAAATGFAANEAPATIQKSFPAAKVTVDGFQGTLTITTAPAGAPVSVHAVGKPDIIKRLDIRQDPNGILIRLESRSKSVWWPWSMLDWSQEHEDDVVMTIGAPKGTEFDMDEIGGRVSAGDLDAPLRFGGIGGGTAKFGTVTRARLEVAGSMNVTLGDSQGPLDVEIAGSGSVRTGAATQTKLEIAGSGAFVSGPLNGGFDGDFAGSGDATVASVDGPVSIDIAGSSKIKISAGRANPFKVSIAGSGDVEFGGEAVDPTISIAGSGDVVVGSMSGSLKQDIQGSGDFRIVGPIKAAPPAEPGPAP